VKGDGENDFVETKRGNKFRNMNLPGVMGDQQSPIGLLTHHQYILNYNLMMKMMYRG